MKNVYRSLAVIALSMMFVSQSYAGFMNFVSDHGDGCRVSGSDCALTTFAHDSWITAADFNAAAGSVGASWVQAEGSYINSNINDYRVYEFDLKENGPWTITDLWISVDDDVSIRHGGNEIWNSASVGGNAWTQAINVTDIIGDIDISANGRLNFYVHDIGDETQGPTGLIYAGTAVAVPEPSIIALFGVGLLGLGFAGRRRTHN